MDIKFIRSDLPLRHEGTKNYNIFRPRRIFRTYPSTISQSYGAGRVKIYFYCLFPPARYRKLKRGGRGRNKKYSNPDLFIDGLGFNI